MDSQHDNLWSGSWWNDTDTVSMFNSTLLDGTPNLDVTGDIGEACFHLPPAIDSSDSDYSFGTYGTPKGFQQDGDDFGGLFPFSPAPSVLSTILPKAEPLEDANSPGAWDYSSPPELDGLQRDSSGTTDVDSCPSPASLSSGVTRKVAVKRLRSSGGVKKVTRKDSGSSDKTNRHNLVEKKYRNRLNHQFELLIATLTEIGHSDMDIDKDRTLSKSSVLQLARQTMLNLERKNKLLNREVDRLTKEARLSQGILVGQGTNGRVPFLL